jgi:hypothetical protein
MALVACPTSSIGTGSKLPTDDAVAAGGDHLIATDAGVGRMRASSTRAMRAPTRAALDDAMLVP